MTILVWDETAVAALTRHWNERLISAAEIALIIGVSRCSVIGKANRLGLPARYVRDPSRSARDRQKVQARVNRKASWYAPKSRGDTKKRNHLTRLMFENVPAPDSLGLSILELGEGQCRYPTTDHSPHEFCGHPQDRGSLLPYCEFHLALCTAPARRRHEESPSLVPLKVAA